MNYVIACVSNVKFGSVGKDRGEKVTFKINEQAVKNATRKPRGLSSN